MMRGLFSLLASRPTLGVLFQPSSFSSSSKFFSTTISLEQRRNRETIKTKHKKGKKQGQQLPSSSSPPSFSSSFDLFVSCLPGLEPFLKQELLALGIQPKEEEGRGGGGVEVRVDSLEKVMECHLCLGTASHVLIRCGEPFKVRKGKEERRGREEEKVGDLFWGLMIEPFPPFFPFFFFFFFPFPPPSSRPVPLLN